MTAYEFYNRTDYIPHEAEFFAICHVYEASGLDKDTWCEAYRHSGAIQDAVVEEIPAAIERGFNPNRPVL